MKVEGDQNIKCLAKLREIFDSLPTSEKRIGELILTQTHDVFAMTIQEIAQKTNTSYATVVRLINKLGADGFKNFKALIYQEVLSENSIDFVDMITFSQGSSVEEICQNTRLLFLETIEQSLEVVDFMALELAAQAIVLAKQVCFVGTGLSGICAKYAASRFFRIGITSIYHEDTTFFKMNTALLSRHDVLFAISSSGRSKQVVECAQIAKENGATIIALSDYEASELSKTATVNLCTTKRHSGNFLDIDMPLLAGQFFLIDALYMYCCVKMGKISSERFVKTKLAINNEKLKKDDAID